MAVNFKDTYSGGWTFRRGTLLTSFDTLETSIGNVVGCGVVYGYSSGIYLSLRFFASTAETYAQITGGATCSFSGDLQGVNTEGALFKSLPGSGRWIDSVTKDSPTELAITTAANSVPWFNYTNATLYERLKELYPGFNSFAFSVYSSGGSALVPNPYYNPPGLNSNYNYSAGQSDFGSCSNAPGVSSQIPAVAYVPNGDAYDGNPPELTGDWASPDALGAYLLLSEPSSEYKIRIDMYIEGKSSPSIGVEWSMFDGTQAAENVPLLDKARIKIYAFAPYINQIIGEFTQVDDGIRRVSDFGLIYGKYESWDVQAGSFDFVDTLYNTISANAMRGMSSAAVIGNYGPNQLPEKLFWYFQVESEDAQNGTQKSTLWQLVEPREWETLYPDHELHEFADGETAYNLIKLEVVLHEGKSDNMDGDDDNDGHGTDDTGDNDGNHGDDWPDFTPYQPSGFTGNNVLTKMYAMSASTLANVGNKLWTQSYFDVLKVQANPIENIVAVKWFPFNPSGTSEEIKIGDVAFGINANKISRMKEITIGSFKYTGRTGFHNFIDQTPFTEIQLHLPYIGTYQIDASILFNNTLAVTYYVDLCTGECMAAVTIDGIPYLNATGMMGVDIPITSSDRVQTELKVLSSSLKTGAGIAGEVLSGDILGAAAGAATGALAICGADYTQQRTNNPSSACGSFQNHAVYLTFAYPDTFTEDGYGLDRAGTGYAHTKGYPCHAWKMLRSFGDFSGNKYNGRSYFVQIDKRTEINIGMTSEENAELERLLTTGVYI